MDGPLTHGRLLMVVTGALWASSCAHALGAEVAFEGESMDPATGSVVAVDDSTATNGRAMAFLNNDRASKGFTSDGTLARILLRLRGDQCGDPPQPRVAVELGSTARRVYAAPVGASSSYRVFEAFVDIPAGEQTLFVHMTNDYNRSASLLGSACGRNLYLDTVAIKDMPRLFAADSYRNAPLADDAPIDPLSAHYRDTLIEHLGGLDGFGPFGVNTTRSSTPVYTVPVNQARVRVAVDQGLLGSRSDASAASLQEQWNDVPLPRGAQPAESGELGRDNHLVVYQPETDTLWEFFEFRYDLFGNPRATYGGRMTNVSENPGHFTGALDSPPGPGTRYGASATSIPLLAGLQRIDELRRGSIDHVVAFLAPNIRYEFCRYPAQRTDSGGPESNEPLPEGIRFRLPPGEITGFDQMTPYGRMVAKAVQKYGMVLTDRGGNFAFEAEDPGPTGTNPYPDGIFGGDDAYGIDHPDDHDFVLRNFPWQDLQAIADPYPARPYAACTVPAPG